MNIVLREPSRADRNVIRRMMELYLHDLSEFDAGDLDEHGLFSYGDLDYFFFEPTHRAFLVTCNAALAGFVLVDNEVYMEGAERSITEFFVLRKYRRQGVGKQVACDVFRCLPASWEVRVMAKNRPAQHFWRNTLTEFTQGAMLETLMDNDDWTGPVFSFNNS